MKDLNRLARKLHIKLDAKQDTLARAENNRVSHPNQADLDRIDNERALADAARAAGYMTPAARALHAKASSRGPLEYAWAPESRDGLRALDALGFAPKKPLECDSARLDWYDGAKLLRLRQGHWETGYHWYILFAEARGEGQLLSLRLDGKSPPIHEMNAKAPIKITESNVIGYLKFFCLFVQGPYGPFHVVESENEPSSPIDETVRAVFQQTVRPAEYVGRDANGHYLVDAIVWYSNALFITNFAVHASGMCQMLADEPIAADMPAWMSFPLSRTVEPIIL